MPTAQWNDFYKIKFLLNQEMKIYIRCLETAAALLAQTNMRF